MFISKILTIFFFALLISCGSKIPQTNNSKEPELSLTMERSACFGRCPIYKLVIQPDSKVIFEGIKFTKFAGKAEINLSESKMKELMAEIDKADFFSLKDSYEYNSGNCPKFWSDAPTVTLSIKLREKEKTIIHNHGCEDATPTKIFPLQLYNLENKIDEIVETKGWVGDWRELK